MRRSDRLPLRVELEGGVVQRISAEHLPAEPALLELTAR